MRRREILTALAVSRMSRPGRHADGDNLHLYVDKAGGKKWTFLYQLNGRQREMGLGSARDVGLAKAREKAAKAREMLAGGIDPLETKRAVARADAARKTFGQVADEYIEHTVQSGRTQFM
jgi:hypothetical protein